MQHNNLLVKHSIYSNDDVEFCVNDDIISQSSTLKQRLLEQQTNGKKKIIVDNVDGKTLSNIVTFLKSDDNARAKLIDSLDADSLYNVTVAAKHLRLDNILKLAGDKIRQALNKSPKEVQIMFKMDQKL